MADTPLRKLYFSFAHAVVILAGIFLFFAIVSFSKPADTGTLFDAHAPTAQRLADWQTYIHAHGPAESYAFLVHNAGTEHLNGIERHALGHLFGEVLYTEVGIEGFLICDQHTEYGCLHEIAARALMESGLGALYELNELCIQTFGELAFNCQHGIGHGLLANSSYSKEDRDDALAICSDLPENNFHSACNSGVFMEYMLHTSLGDDDDPVLAYQGDFLAPCRDLATDMFRGACSMRLPDWWMETILQLSTDLENVHALGEYCIRTGHELDMNDSLCFSGIGNSLILQDEYDPEAVVAICEAASSDPEDQFWCKKVAAKHLLDGTTVPQALRICESMTERIYRTECEREVQERDASNSSVRSLRALPG